ncbi:MAG: hypothetical protein ABR946_05000 [Solirubrobacteraceae bacterium]
MTPEGVPMSKTVILGAARTPIGKLGGGLAAIDAPSLGGVAIRAALERAAVAPAQVEHVVMGTVLQAGQGQIPSRQAQIKAGVPKEVSSETINKVCASGLRAVALLDLGIRAGELDVGVGGGMESMSRAPYLLDGARFGYRMGNQTAIDSMVADGLTSAWTGKHMAEEATEVAAELEITRADMDRWALRSQQRHDSRPQGGHAGRGRRGASARHHSRVARQTAADLRRGRDPHRRQRSRRQRRRRRRRRRERDLGEGQRQGDPRRDRRAGTGRR